MDSERNLMLQSLDPAPECITDSADFLNLARWAGTREAVRMSSPIWPVNEYAPS
jgi:hypothetical protein